MKNHFHNLTAVKLTIIVFFILIAHADSYSQLPNQNTYLLRNLDVAGRSYAACWGYSAPDGREYAILGCNNGTAFIDITDSANITEVDFQSGVSSSWREMKTYSHYAYIVSEGSNSFLQIVDLQYLPDSVHFVKNWNYTGYTKTHSISQEGHFLYLNGGNATSGGTSSGGVAVVDLTDPENPVKRGSWSTRYVHDCRVLNDTIWAANISNQRVTVINATNKDALVEIVNWQNLPNPSPHNCAITKDRKYILVTDENNGPGKLKTWNIEDLGNITLVNTWQPTGITTSIVHNVEIYGDYAVVAHYTSGIRIIDISNPASPQEAAWYDTRPSDNNNSYNGCWGVYKFPSGKIIGSDISNGLFVIKTTFSMADYSFKLNLTAYSEGLYDQALNGLTRRDTVTAYLRQSNSPYSIVDSAKEAIDSVNLKGQFTFKNAPTGNYYVVVKHFNSIETWSKAGGESYQANAGVYDYNFSTAASQAYGNNLVLEGTKYCMYSGDVDRNGFIDLSDIVLIFNASAVFKEGLRIPEDLNGDNIADLSDLTICFNNSANFIGVISPVTFVE